MHEPVLTANCDMMSGMITSRPRHADLTSTLLAGRSSFSGMNGLIGFFREYLLRNFCDILTRLSGNISIFVPLEIRSFALWIITDRGGRTQLWRICWRLPPRDAARKDASVTLNPYCFLYVCNRGHARVWVRSSVLSTRVRCAHWFHC